MIFPFSFWGAFSPKSLPNLSAWYDVSDFSSLRVDSANRVSLVGDKSGNSATNCLVLNGAAGNYASSPDSAAVSITGDIDIRCDVAMVDWTPSAISTLIGKNNGGTNRSYYLSLATNGVINLWLSNLGSDDNVAQSSVSTGFVDGSRNWIRATWRASDGQVQFFTGSDGVNWTQLGTNQTIAIASIFNGTQALNIGARNNSNSEPTAGRIYRAQILNGINGTVAFDANFSLAAKLATSFTESSANAATVTINTSGATGARISGERDLYQGTVANQPIYLPYTGSKYAYLPGVSGAFLSTPDSAAISITGDLDVALDLAEDDYTPASNQVLLAKGTSVVPANLEYALQLNTGGTVTLFWSTGAATLSATSTAALPFADRARGSVRATLDVNNGAAGNTVTFFTGTTFGTWTQLGLAVTQAGVTSIQNSTNALAIGSFTGGTSGLSAAMFYRATISGTIGGTLAFDFNAQSYTTGSTLVDQSVNAATITINGGATIVTAPALYFDGTNDYLKAPPFALSQPETTNAIFSQVTWTANDNIYDGNASGSRCSLYQRSVSPNLTIFAGANGPDASLALKTRAVASAIFNGASSFLRINKLAGSTANAGPQGANGFTLGSGFDGTVPANAVVNEIAIYNSAQSTAQLDQFANYAGGKWGFTV